MSQQDSPNHKEDGSARKLDQFRNLFKQPNAAGRKAHSSENVPSRGHGPLHRTPSPFSKKSAVSGHTRSDKSSPFKKHSPHGTKHLSMERTSKTHKTSRHKHTRNHGDKKMSPHSHERGRHSRERTGHSREKNTHSREKHSNERNNHSPLKNLKKKSKQSPEKRPDAPNMDEPTIMQNTIFENDVGAGVGGGNEIQLAQTRIKERKLQWKPISEPDSDETKKQKREAEADRAIPFIPSIDNAEAALGSKSKSKSHKTEEGKKRKIVEAVKTLMPSPPPKRDSSESRGSGKATRTKETTTVSAERSDRPLRGAVKERNNSTSTPPREVLMPIIAPEPPRTPVKQDHVVARVAKSSPAVAIRKMPSLPSNKVSPNKIPTDKISPNKISSDKISPNRISSDKVSPNKTPSSNKISPNAKTPSDKVLMLAPTTTECTIDASSMCSSTDAAAAAPAPKADPKNMPDSCYLVADIANSQRFANGKKDG